MIGNDHHRLLYKIAQAYYADTLTQEQIAKRYGLSRPKVSRLLSQARAERIVQISLTPPAGGFADLERGLEQRFGLTEAVVAAVSRPGDPHAVARDLGAAAVDCLARRLTGRENVALTWGTTMMALVDALPYQKWPEVTVVQMNGGLGAENMEHSTELASRCVAKLGAKLKLLPAPGVASSAESARALRAEKTIAEALDLAAHAHIALLGLGVMDAESVLLRDGAIVSEKEIRQLRKLRAVGDIALHFVDQEGKAVWEELDERIIGLSLAQLEKIPCVIAVAGGEGKAEIISAALMRRIPKVLVTDAATAEKLMAGDGQ